MKQVAGPPGLARWLLARFLKRSDREFMIGDLEELWLLKLELEGRKRARRWYWRQVLQSLRFITIARFAGSRPNSKQGDPTMFEAILKDLKFAIRLAAKRPGYSLIIMLTLALGIGANTAIYSLLDAFIFRTLPVPHGDRIVSIFNQNPDGTYAQNSSYPQIRDLDEQSQNLQGVMGFSLVRAALNHEGLTEMIFGEAVTGNYFDVLQLKPELGRTFVGQELESKSIAPVVVISHGLWQRRFGADPGILGTTIDLNGVGYSVIGVAPRQFKGSKFGLSMSFWIPVQTMPQFRHWADWDDRGNHWLNAFGRSRAGARLDEIGGELAVISARLEQDHPEEQRGQIARCQWARGVFSEVDPSLAESVNLASSLSLGVALAILLIACANVANLILARTSNRISEMGLRLAIGASRTQLFRQLTLESLVLALAGGLLGVALAFLGTAGMPLLFPAIPYDIHLPTTPNLQVLGLTLVVTLATGILFGLVPLLSLRRDVGLSAQSNLASSRSLPGGWRSRRFLVALQLAASSLLLVISGLFVRSLENAQNIDTGFANSNLLMAGIDLRLASLTPETGSPLLPQLEQSLKSMPGVAEAGLTSNLPLDDSDDGTLVWAEGIQLTREEGIRAEYIVATPGLFPALGIRLKEGRLFTSQDRQDTPKVAIISSSLAERLWPGESAVGRKLSVIGPEGPEWEVIGVLEDVKYHSLAVRQTPAIYLSMLQNYQAVSSIVLKTEVPPAGLVNSLRETIRGVDPDIPVFRVRTYEDHIGQALLPSRMGASLASIFGGVALILASVGLYGLMSFSVSRRIREMGIRTALGADRADLLRLVMFSGTRMVLLGLLAGLLLAFLAEQQISAILYGIGGFDLMTFGSVGLILFIVAMLACYVPARRASVVDPMQALRYE